MKKKQNTPLMILFADVSQFFCKLWGKPHNLQKKTYTLLFAALAAGLLLALAWPVRAALPEQAVYQTPTANAEGRILYKVQPGDSCLRVELLTGVKIETLRTLNKLDDACTLQEGMELLLGVVTEAPTPTQGPEVTPTPLLPTPTQPRGTGEVCIVLFADVNGNAVRDDGEAPILGGAVSITDRSGEISKTGLTTDTTDALCFTNLPEGDYNISMAVPSGYNPTTATNYPLTLLAGNRSIIDFGAQISLRNPPPEQAAGGASRSPLLLVVAAVLILGGAGLGVYFGLLRK